MQALQYAGTAIQAVAAAGPQLAVVSQCVAIVGAVIANKELIQSATDFFVAGWFMIPLLIAFLVLQNWNAYEEDKSATRSIVMSRFKPNSKTHDCKSGFNACLFAVVVRFTHSQVQGWVAFHVDLLTVIECGLPMVWIGGCFCLYESSAKYMTHIIANRDLYYHCCAALTSVPFAFTRSYASTLQAFMQITMAGVLSHYTYCLKRRRVVYALVFSCMSAGLIPAWIPVIVWHGEQLFYAWKFADCTGETLHEKCEKCTITLTRWRVELQFSIVVVICFLLVHFHTVNPCQFMSSQGNVAHVTAQLTTPTAGTHMTEHNQYVGPYPTTFVGTTLFYGDEFTVTLCTKCSASISEHCTVTFDKNEFLSVKKHLMPVYFLRIPASIDKWTASSTLKQWALCHELDIEHKTFFLNCNGYSVRLIPYLSEILAVFASLIYAGALMCCNLSYLQAQCKNTYDAFLFPGHDNVLKAQSCLDVHVYTVGWASLTYFLIELTYQSWYWPHCDVFGYTWLYLIPSTNVARAVCVMIQPRHLEVDTAINGLRGNTKELLDRIKKICTPMGLPSDEICYEVDNKTRLFQGWNVRAFWSFFFVWSSFAFVCLSLYRYSESQNARVLCYGGLLLCRYVMYCRKQRIRQPIVVVKNIERGTTTFLAITPGQLPVQLSYADAKARSTQAARQASPKRW